MAGARGSAVVDAKLDFILAFLDDATDGSSVPPTVPQKGEQYI